MDTTLPHTHRQAYKAHLNSFGDVYDLYNILQTICTEVSRIQPAAGTVELWGRIHPLANLQRLVMHRELLGCTKEETVTGWRAAFKRNIFHVPFHLYGSRTCILQAQQRMKQVPACKIVVVAQGGAETALEDPAGAPAPLDGATEAGPLPAAAQPLPGLDVDF